MENINENNNFEQTASLKDYFNLVRNNMVAVVVIVVTSLIIASIYAITSKDIFKAATDLKISKPQGSVLDSPLMPEFQDFGSDRFIANEIEILKSYNLREKVAYALIDSFNTLNKKQDFYLILDHSKNVNTSKPVLLPKDVIAKMLGDKVAIDQKRGLDIAEISVESPSPFEAALIANVYSMEYRNLNLELSRNILTNVKQFLSQQRNEKQLQLNQSEEALRAYQEKGGIIALDAQADNLIQQLSQFEAQENAAEIELQASNKVLTEYKDELEKQNPRLADYLESMSSESYFKALQDELAEFQIRRDLVLANQNSGVNIQASLKEMDARIADLKAKMNEKIKVIKAGILASSPEEVKALSQRIIDENIKNQTLKITATRLKDVVQGYETRFNSLPKTSIELARYERNRESLEKLYVMLEERYQEAMINEQSQPGNVIIVDDARVPLLPSRPNRMLIIVAGLLFGVVLAFGYVFIRHYFDTTVKTPEDILSRNINVLAWIPQFEGVGIDGAKDNEFIVAQRPDSIPSEAFRALRTRIQFSKVDIESLKTILITSSAPQEGKTTTALNLAGSFAQANKRTLLVDCDLRKPRIHSAFKADKYPGLIDYLFGQVEFKDVIRNTQLSSLQYISSGTIPPNPAEMLDSNAMKLFLKEMREKYDIIIIDSPPVIAVTDSEILSRSVDATVLVVSADATEKELMSRSVELLKNDSAAFVGVVLNNFSYKAGYGSYYKYYYYYSQGGDKVKKKGNRSTPDKA